MRKMLIKSKTPRNLHFHLSISLSPGCFAIRSWCWLVICQNAKSNRNVKVLFSNLIPRGASVEVISIFLFWHTDACGYRELTLIENSVVSKLWCFNDGWLKRMKKRAKKKLLHRVVRQVVDVCWFSLNLFFLLFEAIGIFAFDIKPPQDWLVRR